MPTLQKTIAEKFLAELADKKVLDAPKIDALRTLLQDSRKAKPEDFVKIFTSDGGDLA